MLQFSLHYLLPPSTFIRLSLILTRVSFYSTLTRNMCEITWIDQDATGAGEISISIAAAAVGNATLDAMGIRLRELPFAPERVKAGLSQT